MNLKQGEDEEEREKRKKEGKSRPKDSGSAVRLELVREKEVISVMAVNFSGIVAANTVNGVFRAMARGDSLKGKIK